MRIITEIMSRREAAATRRPELREMRCVAIVEGQSPRYWRAPYGSGHTEILEEAELQPLSWMLDRVTSQSIAFIREGEPEPGPDGNPRLRQAKLVLGHSLYAMVEASPNNPTVRAHIMAKCGEMPKDELDTMQKLVDWIECDLKMADKNAGVPLKAVTRTEPAPAFVVETENTEVERGTCRYSRIEHTRSRVPITAGHIEELIHEDEDNDLEDILERLIEHVDEDAGNHANHEAYTNEEAENHEPTDGDGIGPEFSRAALKQQLIEYLRRTQTPELLRALGINE